MSPLAIRAKSTRRACSNSLSIIISYCGLRNRLLSELQTRPQTYIAQSSEWEEVCGKQLKNGCSWSKILGCSRIFAFYSRTSQLGCGHWLIGNAWQRASSGERVGGRSKAFVQSWVASPYTWPLTNHDASQKQTISYVTPKKARLKKSRSESPISTRHHAVPLNRAERFS